MDGFFDMDIEINKIHIGDSLNLLKRVHDKTIDSVVTDPPYGLRFMGNRWDFDVPSVELWKEVMRVMKPGSHLLSFGGTRTYHRMVYNIEAAGFEIRDQLMWVYSSGFPKSLNIEKFLRNAVKKGRYYVKDSILQKLKGWGTGLKPAHEPMVLARKSLSEKNVTENMLKYGTGGLNIDGCRLDTHAKPRIVRRTKIKNGGFLATLNDSYYTGDKGRWPSNFILDEGAAEMLEEQSSGASSFYYISKPTTKERGEFNRHPTVKPIKLMEHLVKLITPMGGVVLDPFGGSGTTAIACNNLGFDWILFEREPKFVKIAKRRIHQHLSMN